jgi:PBP1b-binding outer membrane lipoprotein LpoB
MKKTILAFAILFSGCSEPTPPPQPAPIVPQAPEVAPAEPPKVEQAPVAPPAPSAPAQSPEFLNGYWDAYTGKISSPKWLYNEDYRDGRREGTKDRSAQVEPRYPR